MNIPIVPVSRLNLYREGLQDKGKELETRRKTTSITSNKAKRIMDIMLLDEVAFDKSTAFHRAAALFGLRLPKVALIALVGVPCYGFFLGKNRVKMPIWVFGMQYF